MFWDNVINIVEYCFILLFFDVGPKCWKKELFLPKKCFRVRSSQFKVQGDQKIKFKDQRRSKDQRSNCFTDQLIKVHQRSRINKIKDQKVQPEIKFLQITDQKFKVQLFTDQITKLDLVRSKPSLLRDEVSYRDGRVLCLLMCKSADSRLYDA